MRSQIRQQFAAPLTIRPLKRIFACSFESPNSSLRTDPFQSHWNPRAWPQSICPTFCDTLSRFVHLSVKPSRLQQEDVMRIVEISEVAPTCHANFKLVESAEVSATCHNDFKLVE